MVELPMLNGEVSSQVCVMCPAKTFFEGKYVCDESKLTSPGQKASVIKSRPLFCPRIKASTSDSHSNSQNVYDLARKMYRR